MPQQSFTSATRRVGRSVPLSHSFPECTGRWRVRTIAGKPVWKCDACGTLGAINLQNHASAIRENALGLMLGNLTRDRRKLLDTDGTAP